MSKQPMSVAPYQGVPSTSSPGSEILTPTSGVNPLQIQQIQQIQRPVLQRNVPAFLNKLYNMVDDESTNDLIRWSEDGTSFIVVRHEDFARKVLPRFFKHSNFSSFVRQLNMYGFHKVPHLQQGVLQADDAMERWEFDNPHFQRNQPDLLLLVTRKKGRDQDDKDVAGIDLHNVLDEIQAIKKHQTTISTQLKSIQRDNQVLWQETVAARERHLRHQETIDKILRFLASVFSADKSVTIPSRKRQFLLESSDDHDDERPSKTLRQSAQKHAASASDARLEADTLLPSSVLPRDSYPSSDFAFDEHTKINHQDASFDATPPLDVSQLFNTQQLQGLQSLISMTQTNPTLLNSLADTHATTPPDLPNTDLSSSLGYPALDPSMLSPLTNISDSPENKDLLPALSQVTNNVATLSKTANAINQDIDALGSDIETLANQLGFDPAKYAGDEDLNLDEFLHTFGNSSAPGSPNALSPQQLEAENPVLSEAKPDLSPPKASHEISTSTTNAKPLP